MSQRSPLVPAADRAPCPELVELVRAKLARGALVALPTETVYGLAARADAPAALERLRELKGRPAELTFTWHVGQRTVLEHFEALRPLARRLVERYWPGPLTLVLRGVPPGLEGIARKGWIGVRLPAHAATAGLLAACDFPVVMSSANRHGEAALTHAEEVAARFGAELELVVDGGSSRLGESSGVLRVGPGHFELLRDGLLRVEDLRRTAGLTLAFVCTGNTCRSPMAEALAKKLLGERLQAGGQGQPKLADFGFEVLSMGLYAAPGAPASGGALSLMSERGLDLKQHGARMATPEALARCDRIYGLTEGHVEALRALLPPARSSAVALLDPVGRDVTDPVGGPRAAYECACADIERALRARLDDWA
ncbi:MAG: threonylcarbamoyl-AMP synthase [Planctomycetes bacterium]|nr:threonylcarbamoyl-AMP synthase [Planctomycetota bacterium]